MSYGFAVLAGAFVATAILKTSPQEAAWSLLFIAALGSAFAAYGIAKDERAR